MSDTKKDLSRFASSPSMDGDVALTGSDLRVIGPEQARDVDRWRRAQRLWLIEKREAMRSTDRRSIADRLIHKVQSHIRDHTIGMTRCVLSAYWPIQGEPDLRPLMFWMHSQGMLVALPSVETKAAPLVFRRWTPNARLIRGHWNIPVPPPDAPELTPDILLAPLVGWDDAGYRLGYGGGYFDRTLAGLVPYPLVIGVGYAASRLPTIFPQPHDIPMDVIVTEAGCTLRDDTR